MKKRTMLLSMMTILMGILLCGCMQMTEKFQIHADGSGELAVEMMYEKDATFEFMNSMAESEAEKMSEEAFVSTMEAGGYKLVERDGKEYFLTTESDLAMTSFGKISEYYSSGGGGNLLRTGEEDYISLTETAVEAAIPKESINSDLWMGDNSATESLGGMEALTQEQLKACKACFSVTFDTPIVKASENAVLSEDKKTASFTFALLEKEVIKFYAYCENDIAVDGVRSGMIYGKDVSFDIPEGVTATVNGVEQTGTKIVCDQTRAYEVILKKGTTQKTLYYVVDKTAPSVKNIENKGVYGSNAKAEITDKDSSVAKIFVDGTDVTSEVPIDMDSASGNITDISYIYSYSLSDLKEGSHTIEAEDKVGNKTTVAFTYDKTAPKVTGVKNNKTYKKAVTIKVSDKYGVKSVKLNGKKIKSGKKVTKKGSYKLVVTDKAGNKTTVTFKIKK